MYARPAVTVLIAVFYLAGCSKTNFSSSSPSHRNGTTGGEECAEELCFVGDYDDAYAALPSNSNSGESKTISFTVPPANSKADILFFIDPSGSMREEMLMIADRFSSFISSMVGLDWRVAISSTDMSATGLVGNAGRLIPFQNLSPATYFITATTPNYAQVFRDTISLPKSETVGDDDERGIYNANLALDRRAEFGFFRPDANLHFVFVSDEDERSSGSNLENFDLPETLISRVGSLLNPPRFTAHSLITRPNDEACLNLNGARYGYIYAEVSRLTRGSIGDICAVDYNQQLLGISYNLIFEGRKYVQLPCSPSLASVRVTLSPVLAGVSHVIAGDRLVFSSLLPPGTRVDVALTCQ